MSSIKTIKEKLPDCFTEEEKDEIVILLIDLAKIYVAVERKN